MLVIYRNSLNIESSMKELIEAVKSPLSAVELNTWANSTRREPDPYTALIISFAQKTIDAFVRCEYISLISTASVSYKLCCRDT